MGGGPVGDRGIGWGVVFLPRFFLGLRRMPETEYSDTRGGRRDPERERQPELDWYMERYDSWRSLFDGRALEESISTMEDQGTDNDQETYRWPVRFNLIKSYCLLYAGMLWGRAKTGAESDDLFDIRVNPKVPGRPGPEAVTMAGDLKDALDYWWSYWFHALRPSGAIQQWAGGCVLKVAWNTQSPTSVFGCQLETIQPEHFYPIWNPANYEELVAVKIKFDVSKAIAIDIFGLTPEQADAIASDRDKINVEEHWDRYGYYVALGKGKRGPDDPGIIATVTEVNGEKTRLQGKNPYVHPLTGRGIIPFVYVPRLRVGGYFGSSLAYDLEGVQNEVNKTLADFGDALTRGSHPPFGISDYHGPGASKPVIAVPVHGALNLGKTPPGREPPKLHNFPLPKVPEQTPAFMDSLLSLSEVATGLTPAARGSVTGAKSGFAMAMEMLPTTNTIDWMRSHWTAAIAGKQGINEILSVIWHSKNGVIEGIPRVSEGALRLRQSIEYRPVVPRDRLEVIDEVVKLATARAVSPQEWLRRLGDVEDPDEEFMRLATWLAWYAQIEAAVAGRAVKVEHTTNPEQTPGALPEISGETVEPAQKQPAKQAEGLKTDASE